MSILRVGEVLQVFRVLLQIRVDNTFRQLHLVPVILATWVVGTMQMPSYCCCFSCLDKTLSFPHLSSDERKRDLAMLEAGPSADGGGGGGGKGAPKPLIPKAADADEEDEGEISSSSDEEEV